MVPYVFQLKKMATNVTKTLEVFFFLEVISRKGFNDLCGKTFVGKSRTITLRANLGKFGQNSFASPKISLLLKV